MSTEFRTLITAPSTPVLSRDEFKSQMGISGSSQDAVIDALISAATSVLDPATNGYLGRALRPQTWEWSSNHFPEYLCRYEDWYSLHRISVPSGPPAPNLPFPPLRSVDLVSYTREDGSTRVLTVNVDYRVFGVGDHKGGRIEPVYEGSWPTDIRPDFNSVKVRFTAGYGTTQVTGGDPIDHMPGAIKQAVALGAKQLMDMSARNLFLSSRTVEGLGTRQYVVSDNAARLIRGTVDYLLLPYMVYE